LLDLANLKKRLQALRAEAAAILEAVEANDHHDLEDPETGQTKAQLAEMGWPLKGDAEPYDNPSEKLSG
jgi:hypothetical protein